MNQSASKTANTKRGLTYGMVGGGSGAFIGGVHRIAAAMDGRATLAAGALSSTPQRAIDSGRELGLDPSRVYPDHRALIAGERTREPGARIDFVVIVTPNDSHFEIARDCLQAGFHVVVDKPMVLSGVQAEELTRLVDTSGVVFAVTYNYSGYPMVRQMRELARSGALGTVRKVFAEYHQGWLSDPIESSHAAEAGQKQAEWRTDPQRAGIAGCVGDIGTHAEQLVRFVTGLEISQLCADVETFVPGRLLDDDASVLLRFVPVDADAGARGVLTCSQVCVGAENGLSLRVYGDRGSVSWRQEQPNTVEHFDKRLGRRILSRGSDGLSPAALAAGRLPPGHPEGYLEAFANIYLGVCDAIEAARDGFEPSAMARLVPGVHDGAAGVRFIERVIESGRHGGAWVGMDRG